MFIELTCKDGKRRLLNSEKIIDIAELSEGCNIVRVGSTFPVVVKESFEEVKKRLGLRIDPRAETIMLGVAGYAEGN